MNTASLSFGRRLRSGRERLGISLEAIAASTKISRSLLADLSGATHRNGRQEFIGARSHVNTPPLSGCRPKRWSQNFSNCFRRRGHHLALGLRQTLQRAPIGTGRGSKPGADRYGAAPAGRHDRALCHRRCGVAACGGHKVGVLDGVRRDRVDLLPSGRGLLDAGSGVRVAGGQAAAHCVRVA